MRRGDTVPLSVRPGKNSPGGGSARRRTALLPPPCPPGARPEGPLRRPGWWAEADGRLRAGPCSWLGLAAGVLRGLAGTFPPPCQGAIFMRKRRIDPGGGEGAASRRQRAGLGRLRAALLPGRASPPFAVFSDKNDCPCGFASPLERVTVLYRARERQRDRPGLARRGQAAGRRREGRGFSQQPEVAEAERSAAEAVRRPVATGFTFVTQRTNSLTSGGAAPFWRRNFFTLQQKGKLPRAAAELLGDAGGEMVCKRQRKDPELFEEAEGSLEGSVAAVEVVSCNRRTEGN